MTVMSSPDRQLAARLNRAAWVVTGLVLVLVGLMRRVKIPLPEGWDFSFLAPFHATLNALTALVLIYALVQIKRRRIAAHRRAMMTALGLSVLFLVSYVAYHFTMPETIYGDLNHDGILSASERLAVAGSRGWYLALLLSHIVLAALSLPFILFTFIRAYTGQYEKHRRMARWVFPMWLYVAVTGPLCYLLLMPYYP